MTEATLKVENLRTHFFTRHGVVKAVDGVGFEVHAGRVLGGASTSLDVYIRANDGTNGAHATLWDAVTGGSSTGRRILGSRVNSPILRCVVWAMETYATFASRANSAIGGIRACGSVFRIPLIRNRLIRRSPVRRGGGGRRAR